MSNLINLYIKKGGFYCTCMHAQSVTFDSATPWTVAHQAPLSMGFSRQEYWSGLPFPSPGDLPDPGIEPRSPALQADALPSEPPVIPSNKHWVSRCLEQSSGEMCVQVGYDAEPSIYQDGSPVFPLSLPSCSRR